MLNSSAGIEPPPSTEIGIDHCIRLRMVLRRRKVLFTAAFEAALGLVLTRFAI